MSARRYIRRGFTLVEILIAVAIVAGLMICIAGALNACTNSFIANQAAADTLQRGRTTMIRLSQQLRAGTDHLPLTSSKQTSFVNGTTITDNGLTFRDEQDNSVRVSYDSQAKALNVQVDGGTTRRLLSNVSAFSVQMVPIRSATAIKTGGGYDELERVTVTISIDPRVDKKTLDGQTLTLSESVTPRARLWN